MVKRERAQLIFDILAVIQSAGGRIKPTHLLYKANLSHDALKRYVMELERGGLVIEQEYKGRKVFALTDKGHAYVEEYRRFKNFSDAFGI